MKAKTKKGVVITTGNTEIIIKEGTEVEVLKINEDLSYSIKYQSKDITLRTRVSADKLEVKTLSDIRLEILEKSTNKVTSKKWLNCTEEEAINHLLPVIKDFKCHIPYYKENSYRIVTGSSEKEFFTCLQVWKEPSFEKSNS